MARAGEARWSGEFGKAFQLASWAISMGSQSRGAIAPRPTYQRLGSLNDPNAKPKKIWSHVCFFVARQLRGQGVMRRLIEAAVEHARKRGATVVEVYPVDPDSPSYRFMGFISSFRAASFREVARGHPPARDAPPGQVVPQEVE